MIQVPAANPPPCLGRVTIATKQEKACRKLHADCKLQTADCRLHNFISLLLPFLCSLALFWGLFDALGLSFGALGPSFGAFVPQVEKIFLGGKLGENSWSKSGHTLIPFFVIFFCKNRFWAVLFDVTFSESFFYRFLAAPG